MCFVALGEKKSRLDNKWIDAQAEVDIKKEDTVAAIYEKIVRNIIIITTNGTA